MQLLQIASDKDVTCAKAVLETVPVVFQFIRHTATDRRAKGLSVQQFRTLAFLRDRPECSLGAVAEFLGLTAPTTSRLVDTLVRKKLVRRVVSPANRREIRLSSTPLGRRLLVGTVNWTREQLAVQLRNLSATRKRRIIAAMQDLQSLFGRS